MPLTAVNSAFLQSIDPQLGFLNLPFTLTDALMERPGMADGVLGIVRDHVEPHGLRVFGMMRGADTIFIFRERSLRRPEDVARMRGKSEEEVTPAGVLRAYRDRNRRKAEATEVA